jgi:peptidoglycan/xylan/chitin deacetylase (PgdA/CDA1 family)
MPSAPEQSLPAMDSQSPRPASRVTKFAISLVFYATAEVWRALLRLAGNSAPPTAVVIYYHHVLSEHRERFARQLDHLLRWTMPLRGDQLELLAANRRYSVVTVDDGWKSFADNAVPELQHRRIPVAMFAISARLGASVDGIGFDRLVTPEELRALDTGTVSIGSHTATHAKMTALSASDAMRELRESRTQLGAILGHDVTMFCFPYGAYSEELIPLCREAGYQRVFTCLPTLASPTEFVQGRVRVDPTDWPLEFHLKLMGAYRWLPKAIALKRRMLAMIRGGSSVGGASTSRMPAA